MKNALVLMLVIVAILFATIDAKAQCANGNCSSANARLDSTLPAPIPVPAPAPAASSAASSSVSTYAYPPATGALVVGGYTAPAPNVAYSTQTYYVQPPAQQIAYSVVPVNYIAPAPVAASSAASTSASSTATAPALIGASVLPGGGQTACSNGGCGGRGGLLKGIRARRGGSFSKSVSISRS